MCVCVGTRKKTTQNADVRRGEVKQHSDEDETILVTNKHLHAHHCFRLFYYFLRFRVHPSCYAQHTASTQTFAAKKFTHMRFRQDSGQGRAQKKKKTLFAPNFEDKRQRTRAIRISILINN